MPETPFFTLAALALLTGACGGNTPDTCANADDCAVTERCLDGVCVPDEIDAAVDAAPTPDAGPPIGAGCSADERSIVDEGGAPIHLCAPTEICRGGSCVGICEALPNPNSNEGCDFWVATPPGYRVAAPPCHAVYLTNTWNAPIRITVTRGDASFDATSFALVPRAGTPPSEWPPLGADGIAEGGSAVLFLSSDPESVLPTNGDPLSCPVAPAVDRAIAQEGTGRGTSFHIRTDGPAAAYDVLPFGGAHAHFPGATLLLPTNAWGLEHVVLATPPGTHVTPGPLFGQVVASEDGTTVRVRPTVDLPALDDSAVVAGEIGTFTLGAGEILQWQLPSGVPDLSGTVFSADRPIAVVAGNRYFRLQPAGAAAGGESTHQQVPSLDALGSEYVGAPYETRRADLADESIAYRLVGVFDATELTSDPAIAELTATLAAGQVLDFRVAGPFAVRSQDAEHPFLLAQIMDTGNVSGGSREGATAAGLPASLGDEEIVHVVPPTHFRSRYAFVTSPRYATTNLVLTRVDDGTGFASVTVDCVGEISGWRDVGTEGTHQVATVDLVRADIDQGACVNGRHTASSARPFGLVVWGLDSLASYAYPAGMDTAAATALPPLL